MANWLKGARRYLPLIGVRGVVTAATSLLRRDQTEYRMSRPEVAFPFWLRLPSSDVDTYQQVFAYQEYAFPTIRPPRVIVDAGANIGLAALYFANTFPDARIIAVEPAACNISLLRKNTAHYPQIEVVEAALWKENAQLDLVDPGIGYWGFRTREQQKMPAAGGAVRQAVRGITIDALLEACAVDYVDVLKIDIEGAEVELFEHPGSWLDRVGLLIIELHDRMRPGCSRSVYRATVGFERAWETGENVYLARADACAAPKPGASSF